MFVLPEKEKSNIEAFFPTSLPSRVWLDGYFQNRVPGITYVDSVSTPTIAFVVTEFHHITFVGWAGRPTEFTSHLESVLTQEVYLGLVWPAVNSLDFPKQNLTGQLSRYEFGSYVPKHEFSRENSVFDTAISFSPISSSNFSLCESKNECLYAYETRERFLQECFGIVAEKNGAYVGNAEVICQSCGKDGTARADLQIVVTESHRRTGVGFSLAKRFIEQTQSQNIQPIWSCNKDNEASEALARKLGFSDVIEFQILNYEIEPGLQKYWVNVLQVMGTSIETKETVVRKLQEQYEFNRMDAHWLVVTYLRERESREVD